MMILKGIALLHLLVQQTGSWVCAEAIIMHSYETGHPILPKLDGNP
jgi:hypothetical protein